MSFVMWVLVAVLAGLLAGFVMKRGSYGRGWDSRSDSRGAWS